MTPMLPQSCDSNVTLEAAVTAGSDDLSITALFEQACTTFDLFIDHGCDFFTLALQILYALLS